MAFRHDHRGQSVVVGTVILFGFLILALSLYQVQVVPAENRDVEFDHSQQTERDLLELRNNLLNTATTGASRSTAIELGTQYPQRVFAINPPQPSGTVTTTSEREIEIDAAIDTDAVSDQNVALFWETDPQFETRSIQYTPRYNELRNPPQLTYEHSFVAAAFDSAVLLRSDQTIVRDTRLSVPTLHGTVSENGVQSSSLDSEAISQQTRTVPITGDGDAVEIRLPTAVGDAAAVADRLVIPEAQDVSAAGDEIVITLEETTVYQLGLSAVSVADGGQSEPQYLVPTGELAGERTVTAGQRVGIEVRDKYNNPVPGATVEIDGGTQTTTDEGRVFVTAEAPGPLVATLPDAAEPYEELVFDVREDGETEATRTFDVQWQESSPTEVAVTADEATLTLQVTDRDPNRGPIEDTEVDVSIGVVAGAGPTAVSFPAGSTTDENGDLDVRLDVDGNDVGDEFDVYASAGDDVDRLRVEIVDEDVVSTGSFSGTVADADDEPIANTDVTFEAADSTFTETITTAGDGTYTVDEVEEGTYDITASADGFGDDTVEDVEIDADEETENVDFTLVETEEEQANFDVAIDDVEDEVTEGETITVEYTIENTGDEEDTQDIQFEVDSENEGTETDVTLGSGDTFSGTFTYETEDGDAPEVTVEVISEDDSDSADVTVNEPAFFETLEAEAGGGNIQNVDVTFEILEEADVEIEITPGDTERFSSVTPNQERTENVEVTGNTNPVDVAVSLIDSDTDEQIVRCEGTLDNNGDFLTINPGPGDSEFDCE